MPRETSQTLDRGLTVLELLAAHPEGLTVNELAGALSVGRTVVYRLVATLEDHRLVRREPGGRLVVWLGVTTLGRAVEPLLRNAAGPALRQLAQEASAIAHLTVAEGPDAVAVAVVEPAGSELPALLRQGARHALERGAAGRAMLRLREGSPAVVASTGDVPGMPHEIAAPVVGVQGIEAAVGVVSPTALDTAVAGQAVVRAAAAVRLVLSGPGD